MGEGTMSPRREANRSRLTQRLPPLEALRFFEAAARHGSFTAAGRELCVTPAAVSHRVKTLEASLGELLFVRQARGVRLNRLGATYLKEVQRILTDICNVTDCQRGHAAARRLAIVAAGIVAELWLTSRLPEFAAAYPDIAIELEIDHGEVDLHRRDFDVWIVFECERSEALQTETLFEETLIPVCSPALLEKRGRPARPEDLHDWPFLYDLEGRSDWSYWFAQHGVSSPDPFRASAFGLYSMVVQAATRGMGVALGYSSMIANELERGTLVALFDSFVPAPARILLASLPDSADKPDVQAFLDWIRVQVSLMHGADHPLTP